MNAVAPRVLGAGLLAAIVAFAPGVSAARVLASCVPPQFQQFSGDPNTVVMAGTVNHLAASQVTFDVQLWWGDGPQRSVIIELPPKDPTVITSADWEPKRGEPWVVIAHRDGDLLRTKVCEQLPGTQATVAEVESSLGAGFAPAAGPSQPPGAQPNGTAAALPIVVAVGGAVAIGSAMVGLAWFLWRRSQGSAR